MYFGCIASFDANNASFDYLVQLPIVINGVTTWIWLFIEVKSRDDFENILKNGPNTKLDSKLKDPALPADFEKQFTDWISFMKPNKESNGCFHGKECYWMLYCDLPLSQSHSSFDTVQEALFTLGGFDFGHFLKNFVCG